MRLPDATYCNECRCVEDGFTEHRHKGVPFTLAHFRAVYCDKHKHFDPKHKTADKEAPCAGSSSSSP